MPAAARIVDYHTCPVHTGGPIAGPGAPSVLIGGLPAAHLADAGNCVGPIDALALIAGRPACRVGNFTAPPWPAEAKP